MTALHCSVVPTNDLFPGVSGRHFDENSVQFEVFETVNYNLNEKRVVTGPIRCLSQYHPTITNSYSYSRQMTLLIDFAIQEL